MNPLAWIDRNAKRIAASLLVLGLLLRAAWALLRPATGASGEASNVAVAIALGRGFSDAYRPGQGYTAHLLPISPSIAGSVYWLFGIGSPLSEFILACWCIGLVLGSFALYYRAFAKLGVARPALLGALAFVCLMPAYVGQESADFRVWEGGLAVFLMALFLDRLLAAEASAEPSRFSLICLAALIALLFFVNPPVGIAAGCCAALFAVRRLPLRETVIAGAATIMFVALLVVPWAVRNDVRLGTPILLRSNTGLELAIANHPAAVSGVDQGRVFAQRLAEIHPINSPGYRRMEEVGGEVAYSRLLGDQTRRWMWSHKADTLRLAIRHVRQVYAPEPWQFAIFGTRQYPGIRAALASIAGVVGLLGIMFSLARRRKGWVYVGMLALLPALELCLFQPVPRYIYLLYALLAFCAADLIWWLFGKASGRTPVVKATASP
jgi:energy-coupling factor transporter transmembrane protein EcfT